MSAVVHRNARTPGLYLRLASVHVRQSRLPPTIKTWAGTWAVRLGGDLAMARTLHRLSAAKVASAKSPGYIADGGNLYLRVALGAETAGKKPTVSRGWIFRFTMAGKT